VLPVNINDRSSGRLYEPDPALNATAFTNVEGAGPAGSAPF